MEMKFSPLDRAAVERIMTWRYPPPYDIYDIDVAGSDAEATISFLLDPENAYYRIEDERGELVAFCCFGRDAQVPGGDYPRPALDIGLGVRPDLTGKGQGRRYVNGVIEYASRVLGAKQLRVTIAAFNLRAQRVWEQAGFKKTGTFARPLDQMQFLVMEKDE